MGWEDRAYNRDDAGGGSISRLMPRPTSLAIVIICVCTALYLLARVVPGIGNVVADGVFTYTNGYWYRQPWRWITFQYIHGDFGQLIWSMLSVYFILPILEQFWGWRRTLMLFTLAGIGGCIALKLLEPIIGSNHILFGSMGGVLGVLAAIAVLAPQMNIMFMMIAPMSMRAVAIIYAVIFALVVLTDRNGSDGAHLGGLAVGTIVPLLMNGAIAKHPLLGNKLARWQQIRTDRAFAAERNEQQEIDRILAKVGEKGMQSLTGGEKRTLARASESQRKRDAARRR